MNTTRLRSVFRSVVLVCATALGLGAWADFAMTNPVTGNAENYTWKFTGTDTWDNVAYWQNSDGANPSAVPGKSGSNVWAPILFDGNNISINATLSVEGWNLRVGLYNGARITLNNLVKWQGDTTMWVTVDENSKLSIPGFKKGVIGQSGQKIELYVAGENGIEFTSELGTSNDQGATFGYYLKGTGSVKYAAVTAANHQIRQADITMTGGAAEVKSKTLVSFTSCNKTFTANATVKVKDANGKVVRTVPLSRVKANETTLTANDIPGSCELVQTATGILLYYVDGEISYVPSINVNFTQGGNLTTTDDVGVGVYVVPGTSWSNLIGNNGTLSSVKAIDSTGAAKVVEGASLTITGTRGYWECKNNGLSSANDLRRGYIDDSADQTTPTVTVSGIPYKKYALVMYFSNDTDGQMFGPVTVNGTNYKWAGNALAECGGTANDAWGSSSSTAYKEGGNYLVIPAQKNEGDLTIVTHRYASNKRAGLAAVQILDATEYIDEVKQIDDNGTLVIERAIEDGDISVNTWSVTSAGDITVTGTEDYTVTMADLAKIDFSGVAGTVTFGAHTSYDLGTSREVPQGFAFGEGSQIFASETRYEYANDVFRIDGVGLATVALSRVDGTTAQVEVVDGAAVRGEGRVSIDGLATMVDATFTNTTELAYKAISRAEIKCDSDATYDESASGLFIKHHPWLSNVADEFSSLSDFTAVVVGQMSPTAKTIFIHLGSSSGDSRRGLLIATTGNKDEVIITTNQEKLVDEDNAVIATVPNAASARHAYVIVKQGQTFTVWVDGVRRGAFAVAADFALGDGGSSGLQVGSDFGGHIYRYGTQGYKNVNADSDGETGVVNVIRIFDYAISDAQAEAVVKAFPYVSAGGLYTRTVAGEADFSAAGAWSKADSDETFAVPEGAEVEGVHYNPSAALTADGDAAVTVNASATVDKFTVGGTGTMTFKKADGCAVKVADAAIINSPVVVEYGALDLAGTPVQLGSAGSITFDCTAIDVAAIYAVTRFQLTGLVARDDEKFTVVKPEAAAGRAVETAYNANGYYELVVTPDHTAGSEVYYTGGYWADIEGNTISVINSENNATCVFAGDTVVVGALFDGAEAWVADSLPANVTNIRIAKDFAFHSGVAGTILGGATLSVDEDATLTFSKGNSANGVTLGAVVVNGPGTVVFDAISVAGAVSGTAPISIAAGKAVTVAATGSIAQAVKLNAGATLTVMGGATVAQPTTDVEGAYVKETAIDGGKVYAVATYAAEADGVSYKTVDEALTMAYTALPASMGKVITVKDSEWEDDGTYASYFTWDAEARTYTVKQFAARVLSAYYETLAAALENVPATGTVLLLQDITLTGAKDAVVFPAKAVTLDLYGHTIGRFANSYYVLDIPNGADVTIKDTSADGTGMVKGTPVASGNTKNPASLIRVKGRLTLESGALVSDYCCVKVDEYPGVGAFVMNGGNLEVIANDQGYTGLTFTIMNWGVATVNGGTHKGNVQSLSYSGNAASKASTLTINGGSFDPANIYLLPYDKTYAPTVKIVSTIDNLTVVNAGLEALNWEIKALDDETVDDKTYKVYTLAQGVEEIDGSGTVEVVADSEEAALKKVAVVPATAEAKAAVAADVYAAYFKKTAKLNELTGKYTVTAELDPAVVFGAEEAATDEQAVLDAVLDAEAEKATLSAKPGLYYSLEGATAVDFQSGAQEGDRVLATGATVSVEKPSVTGPTAFFRIKVSATPAE